MECKFKNSKTCKKTSEYNKALKMIYCAYTRSDGNKHPHIYTTEKQSKHHKTRKVFLKWALIN